MKEKSSKTIFRMRVQEVVKAIGGKLIQSGDKTELKGVSTDSRTVNVDELFIALVGDKFNGHDYAADVCAKGVSCLVVSELREYPDKVSVVKVKNTTKALGDLARYHRRKFKIPVIAVTGSAGKTTTKEMIAGVLETRFKVLKNFKTENNHIGVPLTLLKLNKTHQVAVLEMGTNQPGDIAWLARIAEPTIAVFTNIGESHLERLRNVSGVLREKLQLVRFLAANGKIVFNADDAKLGKINSMNLSQRKIGYSILSKSKWRAENVELTAKNTIRFHAGRQDWNLATPARHNVYNALAAIACGDILKVTHNKIKTALARFNFGMGRHEIDCCKGVWVINDSYNANLVSFKGAVETLHSFKSSGRKILICADMLELGKESKTIHQLAGEIVANHKIDELIAVGEETKYLAETAGIRNSMINIKHYKNAEDVLSELKVYCEPNNVILIKGSRRMKMERVVEALKKILT